MIFFTDTADELIKDLTAEQIATLFKLMYTKKAYTTFNSSAMAKELTINLNTFKNNLQALKKQSAILHIKRDTYVLNPIFFSFDNSYQKRKELIQEYLTMHNNYQLHLAQVKMKDTSTEQLDKRIEYLMQKREQQKQKEILKQQTNNNEQP